MTSNDLLVLAGDAATALESIGFVACGRRIDGVTRVDFWGRDGACFRYALVGDESSVPEVVAACIAMAGEGALPARSARGPSLLS
jgi:hypothetical protein